jgi:PAS domain S-box-containing protein
MTSKLAGLFWGGTEQDFYNLQKSFSEITPDFSLFRADASLNLSDFSNWQVAILLLSPETIQTIETLRNLDPKKPILLLAPPGTENLALEGLKAGAFSLIPYNASVPSNTAAAILSVLSNVAGEDNASYQALFAAAPFAVLILQTQGLILKANPQSSRIFKTQDLIQTNLFDRVIKEEQARAQNLLQKAAGDQPVYAELFFARQDGSRFPAEFTLAPIQNHSESRLVCIITDASARKRAEQQVQRQVKRLSALRAVEMAITATIDLHYTLKVFLEQVRLHLGVDTADILLYNPRSQTLEYAAGLNFRTGALRHTHLRLGEGFAGQAALERKTIRLANLADTPEWLARAPLLATEEFYSYIGIPLIAKGQLKGVLEIFHRSPLSPDPEWFDFLEALSGQAAIAIDNGTLFEDLQRSNNEMMMAYDATIEGWSNALELSQRETEGHAKRVTNLTLRLASRMGLSNQELLHIRRGSLLHDIGKMGIPDLVLFKPGPLNDKEWDVVKKHPLYAYNLLSKVDFLRPALDIPYYHHEKWDGSGYPNNLKGEQIPISARIFSVIDVWDSVTYERPYQMAWSPQKAMEYILHQAGKQFDPRVVDVFSQIYLAR